MAFLDSIGNSIGKMAKSAADKTGDLVETTRLNAKINSLNANITTAKAKLGEQIWLQYKEGVQFDAETNAICLEIKGYSDTIAEIYNEIQAIKTREEQTPDSASAPKTEPTVSFCPACGKQNEAGANFCPGCGGKLTD